MNIPMPNTPSEEQDLPREHFSDDNAYFAYLYKKKKNQQAAAIAKAKEAALAKGKEPFDWKKFDALYEVSDPKSGYVPSEDVVLQYEEKYYCNHPEMMTMEEFAKYLWEMEGWR